MVLGFETLNLNLCKIMRTDRAAICCSKILHAHGFDVTEVDTHMQQEAAATKDYNIEFAETVPLCVSRMYQYNEAGDRLFEPNNSMRFPTVFRQPVAGCSPVRTTGPRTIQRNRNKRTGRVSCLSHKQLVSVISWSVSREASPRFSPLPSHIISRISYHTRRRAARLCGKRRVLRLHQNVTT